MAGRFDPGAWLQLAQPAHAKAQAQTQAPVGPAKDPSDTRAQSGHEATSASTQAPGTWEDYLSAGEGFKKLATPPSGGQLRETATEPDAASNRKSPVVKEDGTIDYSAKAPGGGPAHVLRLMSEWKTDIGKRTVAGLNAANNSWVPAAPREAGPASTQPPTSTSTSTPTGGELPPTNPGSSARLGAPDKAKPPSAIETSQSTAPTTSTPTTSTPKPSTQMPADQVKALATTPAGPGIDPELMTLAEANQAALADFEAARAAVAKFGRNDTSSDYVGAIQSLQSAAGTWAETVAGILKRVQPTGGDDDPVLQQAVSLMKQVQQGIPGGNQQTIDEAMDRVVDTPVPGDVAIAAADLATRQPGSGLSDKLKAQLQLFAPMLRLQALLNGLQLNDPSTN